MFVTRIKALNRSQKAVLIVMGVMILIFTVLYFRTISRVGFEYQDTIFMPYQEVSGKTVSFYCVREENRYVSVGGYGIWALYSEGGSRGDSKG